MTNQPQKSGEVILSEDNAVHCLGTAYVFENRAGRLKRNLQFVSGLGILVPIVLGAAALSYGAESQFLRFLLAPATAFAFLQIVMSGWSLVKGWPDQLAYALQSSSNNRVLSREFGAVAITNPFDAQRFHNLQGQHTTQEGSDGGRGVSNRELRQGHRYALHHLKGRCGSCHNFPTSSGPVFAPFKKKCKSCGEPL